MQFCSVSICIVRHSAVVRKSFRNPSIAAAVEKIVGRKHLLRLPTGTRVFSQGERADFVVFIHSGKVRLSVISAYEKEAELGIWGRGEFLGEESLVEDSVRTTTATTVQPSVVVRVEKTAMLKCLQLHPALSGMFLNLLLARNVSLEADLCDQFFDQSEKRLGRLLLKLSYSKPLGSLQNATIAKVDCKALAGLVGTSCSRIRFLMNRFRRLGLIDYRGSSGITVMAKLLTEVLLASE